MRFRPCIDIHNGKVKQIVGSSLSDGSSDLRENFVSEKDAPFYARLFSQNDLKGGHAIILNKKGTPEYDASLKQCLDALSAFPGGIQAGGGIDDKNAKVFLDAGASHVIVTSFVFSDGRIDYDNLEKISSAVSKEHLVLDMSCKKFDGKYFVMTDRWQKKTEEEFDHKLLEKLSEYCDEFLIHAVDVEGKNSGLSEDVFRILSGFDTLPVTYAGGISTYDDIEKAGRLGGGRVDITFGSALDIYGGNLEFSKVLDICKNL